jgi:hypothetical protein
MESSKYNMNSPSIKRLMRELRELDAENSPDFKAAPLEVIRRLISIETLMKLKDNLFEWHFTIKGPPATDFEGGIYHGRIILPPEYPFKPPNIVLLTVCDSVRIFAFNPISLTEDSRSEKKFAYQYLPTTQSTGNQVGAVSSPKVIDVFLKI